MFLYKLLILSQVTNYKFLVWKKDRLSFMKKISVRVRILLFCLVSVTGFIAGIAIKSNNRDTERKTPGIPDNFLKRYSI